MNFELLSTLVDLGEVRVGLGDVALPSAGTFEVQIIRHLHGTPGVSVVFRYATTEQDYPVLGFVDQKDLIWLRTAGIESLVLAKFSRICDKLMISMQ